MTDKATSALVEVTTNEDIAQFQFSVPGCKQNWRNSWYGRRSSSMSGPLLCNSLVAGPHWLRDIVSLTVTQFCARLKTFCFPEPTRHHHSVSVTVSAVTFACANTNLLTYLLTYLSFLLKEAKRSSAWVCSWQSIPHKSCSHGERLVADLRSRHHRDDGKC